LQGNFKFADVAVGSEGRFDILKGQQTVGTIISQELDQPRGLVYIPKRDVFLFTNSQPLVATAIFQLRINSTNISSSQITPLVKACNYTTHIN
jgi:hypothetical protein